MRKLRPSEHSLLLQVHRAGAHERMTAWITARSLDRRGLVRARWKTPDRYTIAITPAGRVFARKLEQS